MYPTEKWLWSEVKNLLNSRGAMFCLLDQDADHKHNEVLSSLNVSIEPFNGSEAKALSDVLVEARKVGKPHYHGIKKLALSNILPRHGIKGGCCSVIAFCEVECENLTFCLLSVPVENQRNDELITTLKGLTVAMADYFVAKVMRDRIQKRLETVEIYTKEVGHDLANAAQALLAKVRAISDVDLSTAAMKRKALEAIGEIKQVYGIADGLGLAIEQNYVARSNLRFDISNVLNDVINHLTQEASEHKVKLILQEDISGQIQGDKSAIQLALQQLIGNAIKYSYSDRDINITVRNEGDQIVISISNEGIGLPKGREAVKMFDFGVRSKLAKERHVNGSGIGLYTSRKIAIAHSGRLWHQQDGARTIFCLALPPAEEKKPRIKRR